MPYPPSTAITIENAVVRNATNMLFAAHCLKSNVEVSVVNMLTYPAAVGSFGTNVGAAVYISEFVLRDVEIIHTKGNNARIHTMIVSIIVIAFPVFLVVIIHPPPLC
jgi:signal transduction histidine kinase